MKLYEKLNKRVEDKEYKIWYDNLIKKQIKDLEWDKDQVLKVKIKDNSLILGSVI